MHSGVPMITLGEPEIDDCCEGQQVRLSESAYMPANCTQVLHHIDEDRSNIANRGEFQPVFVAHRFVASIETQTYVLRYRGGNEGEGSQNE